MKSSSEHCTENLVDLTQQPLKDECKSASKHKVLSEELRDKVDGGPLGVEPRQGLDKDLKFQGHAVKDLYFLELFAGTARLTKCFGQSGFKAMAFDKTSKRSEGQSVLEYDLSNRDEVMSLLSFIKANADRIALIHLAPPCGTASRARGKRLHFLRAHNIKEPRPLRDDSYPDGFPWLQGSDKIRTEAANLVYEHTVLIAQTLTAIQLQIAVTIENPANSLMWKTSPFVQLFEMKCFQNSNLSLFTIVHMEGYATNSPVLQPTFHGLIHWPCCVTSNILTLHGLQQSLPAKFIILRILKLHILKIYVSELCQWF